MTRKHIIVTLVIVCSVTLVYGFIHKYSTSKVTTRSTDQASSEMQRYTSDIYPFSFEHGKAVTVESSSFDDGTMVLVTDTSSHKVFQIYVQKTGDDTFAITESRIRQDIPDLVIRDAQTVEMSNGATGIAFVSKDDQGEKREVWFAFKGNLYQLSAPYESDDFVKSILNTWEFNTHL